MYSLLRIIVNILFLFIYYSCDIFGYKIITIVTINYKITKYVIYVNFKVTIVYIPIMVFNYYYYYYYIC